MNASNDLISVLIPTYNSEKRLIKCFESVRKQTYSNMEILVCDGGSTDKTIDIINKYCKIDSRFKLIVSDKKGRCHQRNLLLDKANGTYIFMMDSDDTISHSCIYKLYRLIKTKYDVVMPQIVLVDEKDKKYGLYNGINKTVTKTITRQNVFDNLLKINIIGCTKMYKKSFIGNHRYDEDLVFGEDVMFNLILSLNNNYKYCYTTSAKYYYYRPETMHTESKYIKDARSLLEKLYFMANNNENVNIKKQLDDLLHYYLLFFMIRYFIRFRFAPSYHFKFRFYLLFHSNINCRKKLLLVFPIVYCGLRLFRRLFKRLSNRP